MYDSQNYLLITCIPFKTKIKTVMIQNGRK